MRKGVLYESVKRFVKTRKEDLNAFFTTSLRMRKFEISCCVWYHLPYRLIFLRGPNLAQKSLYRHPVLKRESYLLISAIRTTSREWKTTHKVIEKDTTTIAEHKDLHC